MVRRVGLSLQRMLQREYGNVFERASESSDPTAEMRIRNPSLSKYHTPAQALERLRDQFKAYIRAEDPFNRKMRSHEGPLQWTSRPIESTITWLNSPYRSQQQVGTLQDHVKIRQWHRYKPEVRSPVNFYVFNSLISMIVLRNFVRLHTSLL